MIKNRDRRRRKAPLLTAAALVWLLIVAAPASAAGRPTTDYMSETPTSLEQQLAQQVASYVNNERAARGIATVPWNAREAKWAQAQSEKIAAEGGCSGQACHDTGGVTTGPDYEWNSYPEAVSGTGGTSGHSVVILMESAPHKNVVLASGAYALGVGAACQSNGTLWVTVRMVTPDDDRSAWRSSPGPAGAARTSASEGSQCSKPTQTTSPPTTQKPSAPPTTQKPSSPPSTQRPPSSGGSSTPPPTSRPSPSQPAPSNGGGGQPTNNPASPGGSSISVPPASGASPGGNRPAPVTPVTVIGPNGETIVVPPTSTSVLAVGENLVEFEPVAERRSAAPREEGPGAGSRTMPATMLAAVAAIVAAPTAVVVVRRRRRLQADSDVA